MKKLHLFGGIGVGLAVILAAYLGWALLLSPVNAEIEKEEANVTGLRAKLQEAKTKKAEHERFKAEAENINRSLLFVQSRIDSSFGENDVYREFNGLGASMGLKEYTLKAMKPSKRDKLQEYPVEVTFKSSYHQLGEFINLAISRRRVIVPTKAELTGLGTRGQGESISVKMELAAVAEPRAGGGKK